MKVLLVASEAYPFIKTGGIGYTAGFLPKALRKKDIDIRVVIPKYKNLDADIKKKLNFIKWYTVSWVGEINIVEFWNMKKIMLSIIY